MLTRNNEEVVHFPTDDEKNANGIVSISWHGPHISNFREIIALDLIFNFLSNSSISALHSHFIDNKSYVSLNLLSTRTKIKIKYLIILK